MAAPKVLTSASVKAARAGAKQRDLSDGGCQGLSLRVEVSGTKSWRFRYRLRADGQRRHLPLGRFPEVSLANARALANAAREQVRNGGDPFADRKRVKTSGTVAAAIAGYEASIAAKLKASTIRTYTSALRRFELWCDREGIETLDDIDRMSLSSLRDYLVSVQPFEALGGTDKRKKTTRARSRQTVNGELRVLKCLLNTLRRQGRLPRFDSDTIKDCLPAFRVAKPAPGHLSTGEIGQLVASALRHDAERFEVTRQELRADGPRGETPRYIPIAPFVTFLLATGMRRGEALGLTWDCVALDALDEDGETVGEIRLSSATTKTGVARIVGLEVSPAVRSLLVALKLRATGPRVFEGLTPGVVESTAQRLVASFGAPKFSYQRLRKTCSTYLTNATGIFGANSSWLSAKQLGHSVQVAERNYSGQLRGIPRDAKTLEAAMRCEACFAAVIDAVIDSAPVGLRAV